MHKPVSTNAAPAAVGPYSQAINLGGLIYTSGQLPINPATKEMPADIAAQARQSLENLKAILLEAGSGLDKVVKVNIFLTDMAEFGTVNQVYSTFFSQPYPARSTIGAASLPLGAKVEIEAVAHVADCGCSCACDS